MARGYAFHDKGEYSPFDDNDVVREILSDNGILDDRIPAGCMGLCGRSADNGFRARRWWHLPRSLPSTKIMDDPVRDDSPQSVPLGQRLFDNVWLLLGLGLLVMFLVFTAWGLWEIYSLPVATLP